MTYVLVGSLTQYGGFYTLYTGWLFHCYMLNESICHFRGVRSILSHLFYFWWKILLAYKRHILLRLIWDCTVCLWPIYGFPGKNALKVKWINCSESIEFWTPWAGLWKFENTGLHLSYATTTIFWLFRTCLLHTSLTEILAMDGWMTCNFSLF